ncbi:hypothetical protein MKX03_009942 [Papaver bracteatum]|nr:hypothetical protein MKX03_009942 [Papaver bracteatum]
MVAVANIVKVKEERPIEEEPDSHINIKVASNDIRGNGTVVGFRIKRNARMGKLMQAYCDAFKIDITSIKFILDGTQIKQEHTADQLKLVEGDEIQVVQDMIGGGWLGLNVMMKVQYIVVIFFS